MIDVDLDAFCDGIQGLCTAASGADFSPDSAYRYALWRVWDPDSAGGNVAMFGLNPSTADETTNDMTVTKDIGFAKRWGHGGYYKFNPWAYCATNREDMVQATDPVGPRNDASLAEYLANCNFTRYVACWGGLPAKWRLRLGWQQRIETVLRIINQPVYCLGLTADGFPKHTSRLGYDTPLQLFWSP